MVLALQPAISILKFCVTTVLWENLKGHGGFSFRNICGKRTKLYFGLMKRLLCELGSLPFSFGSVTHLLCNFGKALNLSVPKSASIKDMKKRMYHDCNGSPLRKRFRATSVLVLHLIFHHCPWLSPCLALGNPSHIEPIGRV